ncbi:MULTISPECIES: hypothetical protein [Tsukamurella]|uniref:Lipoprotein n=2 Tax=Tsukamurella TaxID=2060 RepID=A0A5C5S645_9ACTN|nr:MULTISPECIES: hypothetical protein [Tsukamurella]NMD55015.1 hypothetical protein [Tsukamurella columbiensis]TWS30048.1 hypothetical protein FK530_05890 [Tsukamurella conjunctivitidis]
MRVKSTVVLVVAAAISACSPGESIVDTWTPSTASSTASAPNAPAADLERVRDLVVGTWLKTEPTVTVWVRYLADGTQQTVDFSGRVLDSRRWELIPVAVSDGVTVAAVQTGGDPRTRMLIGAIDWQSMTLSVPGRGLSHYFTRVGASPLREWYSGHGRGLTIRADGTGTGYYKTVCDQRGANCVDRVSYDFALKAVVTTPPTGLAGSGYVTAEQVITAARPSSAMPLLTPDTLRLDLEADIISTAPSFDNAAFCGARARPSACGA